MADISVVVTTEDVRVSDTPTVPTRFYFPSSGASDVSPAFDAAWNSSGSAVRRKLPLPGEHRTTAMATTTITSSATNPEKSLVAQYVSPPLRAQTLSGNLRGQFRALESAAGLNATLQIGVRVVSKDGATVRATLLAVGGTTTTATTPPELATSLTNRRLLTVGDVTPLVLTSYTCVDGDRLVIELGLNDKSVSTVQTGGISLGDDSTDLPENDTTTTAQNPWVEFDSTIRFQTEVEAVHVVDSGTTQLMNQGWVKANERDEIAAAIGLGSALFHQENLKLSDSSLTVVLNLGAIVTGENLKLADGPVTALLLEAGLARAVADENLKLADTTSQTLDPERGAPGDENVKLADSVTAMLVLLANVSEAIKCGDIGGGSTALIGVVHVVDGPPVAALVAPGALSSQAADENLKLADTVTASRDLTATLQEDVKLADAVTVSRGLTASAQEDLKLADSASRTLDPEETSHQEALKLADALSAALQWAVAVADETLKLADGAPGASLDPLQASASEALKLQDQVNSSAFLQASPTGEAVKLTDTLAASLDHLEAAPVDEVLFLAEAPVVAQPTVLNLVVQAENVRISDRVVILSAVITESLLLSDAGRSATQLIGTLRIQDGPVVAQLGSLLSAGPTETLKLADPVGAERTPFEVALQETLRLGWTESEAEYTQDEYLSVLDTVNASLMAPNDLSTFVAGEALRLADTPTARRDLEVAAPAEAVKLADAVTMSRDVEATPSEAAKLADSVTVARDLTASLAESLAVGDQTPVRILDPLERALVDEAVRVQDAETAVIGNEADLTSALQDEMLRLADTVTVSRGLDAAIGETLRIGEQQDFGFAEPLNVLVGAEALRVGDVMAPAITPMRAPIDSEDVSVSDAVSAVLAVPLVVAVEHASVGEDLLQVAMDLAVEIPGPDPIPIDAIAITDEALSGDVFTEQTLSGSAFSDERLRADL